jgi:hypothetical protein
MLLTLLAELVQVLALGLIAVFPTYTPPHGPGFSALAAANIVIPLDVWSVCMGVTIACMGYAFVVWAALKAFNMIRGAGA